MLTFSLVYAFLLGAMHKPDQAWLFASFVLKGQIRRVFQGTMLVKLILLTGATCSNAAAIIELLNYILLFPKIAWNVGMLCAGHCSCFFLSSKSWEGAAALVPTQVRIKNPSTCTTDTCSCADLETIDMETGNVLASNQSQIHAVKYWPEPVGYQEVFADRSRDPYNHNYQEPVEIF